MTEQEYQQALERVARLYKIKTPNIPDRILNTSKENIAKVYGKTYKQLYNDLLVELVTNYGVTSTPSYQSQIATLNLIETRLKELDVSMSATVLKEVETNFISGKAYHKLLSGSVKSVKGLSDAVPYSTLTSYRVEQLASDTMGDLLFATQHTSKELKKLVREIFSKNLQYHGMTGENYNTIKKLIEKQLSKQAIASDLTHKGFVGIVDKSGRKWNTKVYVDMATNTKMHQVYVEGIKESALETGEDLAIIPDKSSKDSCSLFEGVIISLTGATKGFLPYDKLRDTGLIFHPNCRHTPVPIGDISLLTEFELSTHKEKMMQLKTKI